MENVSRQTKTERYIEALKNNIQKQKYEVLNSVNESNVFSFYIKAEQHKLSFIGKISPTGCPDYYLQGNAFYIPFSGSYGLYLKASLYQPDDNIFILSLFHNRIDKGNPLIRIKISNYNATIEE